MKTFKQILLFSLLLASVFLYATAAVAKGGTVIFDMTGNPGNLAIDVNLYLSAPGSKGGTAINDGYGGNSINIEDFQVLWRDVFKDPNELKLSIGIQDNTVVEEQFGCGDEEEDEGTGCEGKEQNNQFASGGHLFDLDRLRKIADWMSAGGPMGDGNHAISTSLPAGTYGTISYSQFLDNIVNDRTMYGVVRVKVPLELGQCNSAANCGKNALGSIVDKTTIYGLCKNATGLCASSDIKREKEVGGIITTEIVEIPNCVLGKSDITDGANICGHKIEGTDAPYNKKIRVKGSLMWDFVASAPNVAAGLDQGDPVPLDLLPWAPRELYFKVIIPINVNWEHDLDNDGNMDNMFYIRDVSKSKVIPPGETEVAIKEPLDYTMVPESSKADFLYYTGKKLTAGRFKKLDVPNQYHLMMANGYAGGWEEAFSKLGITAEEWRNIPGVQPKLSLPHDLTGAITADDVRSSSFEDIPAYMYTGGLIDMHNHVSISGLVYVPQGMELEAKKSGAGQYVIGAVVVRDTFYIEAGGDTVTLISSDPTTYSTALLSPEAQGASTQLDISFGGTIAAPPVGGSGNDEDNDDDSAKPHPGTCYSGCGASVSSHEPGDSRWIEVRPQD